MVKVHVVVDIYVRAYLRIATQADQVAVQYQMGETNTSFTLVGGLLQEIMPR